MEMERRRRIRYVKPIDYSKIRPMTEDELGLDSPERRRFRQEQKARAPYWDNFFDTVDLSRFGSKVGVSYQNSKKLRNLIKQAIALKKRLEAHMKNHHPNKDSEKLLESLGHVIRIVTSYYETTRDLPFDWIKKSFLPKFPRGSKVSYPAAESDNLLVGSEPEVTCVSSDDDDDDDECETVNGSKTVEGHSKGPDFSKLVTHYPGVHRQYLRIGHGMQHFPNENEKKIWEEFRNFEKGTREAEVTNPEFVNEKIRSIEADHPIVSVVGNFAVTAFNKACNKHVKKDEHENLHDFEFMECKYVKAYHFYHFYLIIEAIEEGISGTYLAQVACNSFDGASVLCKFVLTDYEPSGTKAMAASYLSCLKSICKTMDDLYTEKLTRLTKLEGSLKDSQRLLAMIETNRLKYRHAKIWEGLIAKRFEHAEFHFPPDCKRRTDPVFAGQHKKTRSNSEPPPYYHLYVDWSDPADDCCSGMMLRAEDTIWSGYDYYNPYCHGIGVWYF